MKNTPIIIGAIVIVLVLIIGAVLFLGMNNNSNIPTNNPPVTNTPATGNAKTYTVDIQNFQFSPSTITIKAGDSVTWTNMDSMSHTVTSSSRNELNSPTLANGKTYSNTFSTPGTYSYYCTIHPSMKATVIVQ